MRHILFLGALVGACIAVAILAQHDETPPHWEEVCVKQEFSHVITTFVYVNKIMMPINTPVYDCMKTERQCVAGKDFDGVRECAK